MSNTKEIVNYISSGSYLELDRDTIEQAKLCFLDWIGVTVTGSHEEPTIKLRKLVEQFGGNKQCTIIGTSDKTSAPWSALLNGTSSHVLDFDDIHAVYPGHYTAPIIPSIFALCELYNLSGLQFIRSFVVGAQVMGAIEASVMPDHYKKGWHNTGTIGHFGSTAASSVLLGLDNEQISHALGIAASQVSSIHASFGSMTKSLHAGKAAMNGLLSGMLAKENFTGSESVFEQNFLELISTSVNYDEISKNLYRTPVIHDLRIKQFPCGTATHPTIINAIKIRNLHKVDPSSIKTVTLIVYPRAFQCAAIEKPNSGLEGKFSLHYCFARALIYGKVGLEAFTDDAVNDERVLNLLPKVKLISEPKYADTRSSTIIIERSNGSQITETATPFDENNNLSRIKKNVISKFKDIMESYMDQRYIDKFIDIIMQLEKVSDMNIIANELLNAINRK
ncbi:MmgE/PrpD family protein [Bacillus sp. Marseille-P3661]|uniref:MmgE/PrpD family protein n=1 Tax=Bacillus sp. Marseille-P3661 TaxID=1936234 RepID=UPI0015E1A942|nr:MmgE/PrpD family protein [Bacillus sp. Marseille-P3661]